MDLLRSSVSTHTDGRRPTPTRRTVWGSITCFAALEGLKCILSVPLKSTSADWSVGGCQWCIGAGRKATVTCTDEWPGKWNGFEVRLSSSLTDEDVTLPMEMCSRRNLPSTWSWQWMGHVSGFVRDTSLFVTSAAVVSGCLPSSLSPSFTASNKLISTSPAPMVTSSFPDIPLFLRRSAMSISTVDIWNLTVGSPVVLSCFLSMTRRGVSTLARRSIDSRGGGGRGREGGGSGLVAVSGC
mmetsp:Transcript_37675/g.94505  ORF Transcript_37675/g.94505 Transcript_37675/m.94505 type:complete len:240 (-) Transcript_37675:3556-4275(-)